MKNEFVNLHDEMIDYEHNILSDVEMLSDLRNKIYKNKCKEDLKLVRPILNSILHDTERYIGWLEGKV